MGHQSVGAKALELWCLYLVKMFLVLISRMGFRKMIFSFVTNVCVPDISWFYRSIASMNERTLSRKLKIKRWGHQSSGA